MPVAIKSRTKKTTRKVSSKKTLKPAPKSTGGHNYVSTASGVITGNVDIANAHSDSGDYFHEQYIYTLSIPGIYSHDYGVKLDWDFMVNGGLTCAYNIPCQVTFQFPDRVYPGEIIRPTPTFVWSIPGQKPTLNVTHNYDYSHLTSLWCDAPFDGLDATTISFRQEKSKAHIDFGIPVCPGFPAMSSGTDIPLPPFNSGGGNYEGFFARLGGSGILKNTGTAIAYTDPTQITLSTPAATSAPCWNTGAELFELVANILKDIGVTVAAGAALDVVRTLGGLKLKMQIDGSIARLDFFNLLTYGSAAMQVPSTLRPGETWSFTDLEVKVNYQVWFNSEFYYPVGCTATFDMNMIAPVDLVSTDLLAIPAGSAPCQKFDLECVFRVSGSIPVVPKYSLSPPVEVPVDSVKQEQLMANCVAAATKGMKIADKKTTNRVLRKSAKTSLPKPDGSLPKEGQYTVSVGLASAADAQKIVDGLKRKRVPAYMLPMGATHQTAITLGTFTDRSQAVALQEIVRNAFHIECSLTTGNDLQQLKPIEQDAFKKVSSTKHK